MSTSTTLRLAGLVAAIAVSLSVTSSALAKPEGMAASQTAATQALQGRVDNPAQVGTPIIPLPAFTADNPADVGSPEIRVAMGPVHHPAQVRNPKLRTAPRVHLFGSANRIRLPGRDPRRPRRPRTRCPRGFRNGHVARRRL